MGKLYLIILNMSSFFPYLTLQRRYLCFIHTLSTCIPHKIHIKPQSYPHSCRISFQKKKADSVSISVQCCTPTFRKSYFYLPVYPFSEQFFPLLFTDLIIIFCCPDFGKWRFWIKGLKLFWLTTGRSIRKKLRFIMRAALFLM